MSGPRQASTSGTSLTGETAAVLASQMYLRYHSDVFRYVRSRVSSQVVAEDLTSDVFCKALAGIASYRVMRSSALPWLYTIASHRVIDHYRASRPTSELDDGVQLVDRGPDPAELVVSQDLVHQVWEASKGLPDSQRRALWMRYGEELELREISVRMGRSVEAVKLLVHRAIRGLRTRLQVPVAVPALQVVAAPTAPSRARLNRTSARKSQALAA